MDAIASFDLPPSTTTTTTPQSESDSGSNSHSNSSTTSDGETDTNTEETTSSHEAPWNLATNDPIPFSITLKSGVVLKEIHHIILCTGYLFTLPFLPNFHSDTTPANLASPTHLITDGTQIHNLHRDIFYIPDPSLAFVGVPYFTATFTLFEFQGIVVAKVFSGQVDLPREEEMRSEYEERVRVKGVGKVFHSLKDREVEYVDGLLGWVNGELGKRREAAGGGGEGEWEVKGHTEEWKVAKVEQVERIKRIMEGKEWGGVVTTSIV